MQLCLVNDSSHNPNWGCRGTSWALRHGLAERGLQVGTTIYLEELQGIQPTDRRYGRRLVRWLDAHGPRRPIIRSLAATAFDKVRPNLPDVVPHTAAGLDQAADAMLRGHILESMLERMRAADGVIVNGEGAVYGGQRKGKALMLLAYVAKTRLGKWVGFVNHTADLSDPHMLGYAQLVYPLLDLVTFRDGLSVAASAPFLPRGLNVPDAAFRYRPAGKEAWLRVAARPGYFDVWPDSAPFDPTAGYVAVGGSALLARARSAAPGAGFVALLRALQAEGLQVVLTASDVPDERLFRGLASELGLPLIGLATPVTQAVDLLGGARAYIGGRWHPAIYSLAGGTPFVPLSTNSHKLRALAYEYDLPHPGADALDLSGGVNEVVGLTLAHLSAGEPLRQRLAARAEQDRRAAAELYGLVPGAVPDGPATSASPGAKGVAA